jgi:hypothetical protein
MDLVYSLALNQGQPEVYAGNYELELDLTVRFSPSFYLLILLSTSALFSSGSQAVPVCPSAQRTGFLAVHKYEAVRPFSKSRKHSSHQLLFLLLLYKRAGAILGVHFRNPHYWSGV